MKLIMKYGVFVLLSLCAAGLYSQTNSIDFNIEYTPNVSRLTENFRDPRFSFSQQLFGRVELNVTPRWGLSVGLGYVNARQRGTFPDWDPAYGVSKIELVTNHDYVTVPLGVKYQIGTWFFRPEIGAGVNFSSPGRLNRQIIYMLSGEKRVTRWDNFNQRAYNDFSFPLFLSIVKEFRLSTNTLQVGVKGFYSLEKVVLETIRSQHYMGFGLLTAVRL